MTGLATTLRTIWRLAAPYFRSEDQRAGRVLLAAIVGIELGIVALTVLLNQWNNAFYNALQDRDWNVFVYQLGYFCVLAATFVVAAVYQLYLNQWLQIRWRRWMTDRYLDLWLAPANHYRMQLLGDAADNPDQRIAEDIRLFVENTLTIGLGLLNSVVTLASFTVILWTLSDKTPLVLFSTPVAIPGYLLWAALLYAAAGTVLTHLIGKPLAALNFNQQRFEADFRFNLVRTRENSEQIALLRGETAERGRLRERFGQVVANWMALMSRQKKLTFFTTGYTQASVVFPFVIVSPAYFSGAVQLGGLMQTASAFGSVQTALSFFVNTYRSLAEWRAIIARLDGFDVAIAAGMAAAGRSPSIGVEQRADSTPLEIGALQVELPNGTHLFTSDALRVAGGDRILLTGPTGSGKSTFFRAVAGVWPFGRGSVVIGEPARMMTLPQRPYFPVGSLAAAVSYPAAPGTFSHEALTRAMGAVGLDRLVARLDEHAHWNRMLSLGEQQRLGIARALLFAPDVLFLDEATASLDEPSEAALYGLLAERLPHAAIVSIGHRTTLGAFHTRRWRLAPQAGEPSRLRDESAVPQDA